MDFPNASPIPLIEVKASFPPSVNAPTNELKSFPQNSDISLLAEFPKSGMDKL